MTDVPEKSTEDFIREATRPSRRTWLVALAVVLAIAAGVGIVGKLSGSGWFGYRSILYGSGELYALNMSDQPLFVSVDGRQRDRVEPHNARLVELVGGTSSVVVTDASEKVVGRYRVTAKNSDALLKLTDDACLAAVDLTPYYGGQKVDRLVFLDKLDADTRVWIPHSHNVVWPRKSFPQRLTAGEGEGVWVELVACELLEEPDFLDAYLSLRLKERMARARKQTGKE